MTENQRIISLSSTCFAPPSTTVQAFQAACRALAKDPALLNAYVPVSGHPDLKTRIRAMTPTWPGDTLVTPSGTHAIFLTLNEIQARGARKIAIKIPAYYGVLRQAAQIGLEIEPWESVDDLDSLGSVDAILLTSNFTPPDGRSFSPEDKARIANIAQENNAWIIEDNPYDPIWYGNCFPDPIDGDPERIIRIGSLSKAPGPWLNMGFTETASKNVAKGLLGQLSRQGALVNAFSQAAMAHILTDDVLAAHRNEMRERATILRDALEQETRIIVPRPDGGPFLRLDLPEGMTAEQAQAALNRQNLVVDTNAAYYPDGISRPWLRLNIGAAEQKDLPEATRRIAAAILTPAL